MKCIIIGPAFPLRGGIANFNEALCKAFNEKRINCSIVSFYLQYPEILFPGKSQNEEGPGPRGLNILPMISSINPVSWFRVASFIKKEKPDFVLIRYWLPFMAPCLGTIARLIKNKIIIIAITDNIIPHEKRPGDYILTKYFVSACHAFVAMSTAVLADLTHFTDNKNKYFSPHPVYDIFGEKVNKSEARKHLGLEENGRYILFFGFIRRYKGLDLLLEAMSKPEIKNEKIKLIVAGEFYEDEKFSHDFITKSGLENDIILTKSFIPREEVKYYFGAADLVVQPYRDATQSGVTQIAYHFERPMLVTRVGGLSEIVSHQLVGYVTNVDPDSIAESLLDFYQNKREGEFSLNAGVEKKKFAWNFFVENILKVYKSLL